MRTGTGVTIASQDAPSTPAVFVAALHELGAEFYVHHVIPTEQSNDALLSDLSAAGINVVLGNEYGNINGPYVEDTNRYDIPAELISAAAASGTLMGVLYDEPEHLQIHGDQYRTDDFLPQFGDTSGMSAEAAIDTIDSAVRGIVDEVSTAANASGRAIPVLSEQVFPVLFHTLARAGMTPCPKVMKESFQPLQLSTALGASQQYDREFWVCADLWGPDIGPWFTRAPGLPGHSPAEFASALRMAYYFAPTAMFVENVDVLLQHSHEAGFELTEYGEVWREFREGFVPANPLHWRFDQADADIVLIHAEDSDFGRHTQPFGNRLATAPETAASVFEAWNLLSHGTIPAHGSSLHIPGYEFPRRLLNEIPRDQFPLEAGATEQTHLHGLFHAARNVLVFDEHVRDERLGNPQLVLAVGSRLPSETLALLRQRADAGATVVVARWLTSAPWSQTEKVGAGQWIVFDSLADDEVLAATQPLLGRSDQWTQRFGNAEVRITAADSHGETLEFEIARSTRA